MGVRVQVHKRCKGTRGLRVQEVQGMWGTRHNDARGVRGTRAQGV